ncbi:hypothetical protein Zmor_015252 [Zophobas morio]|uniref:Cytochrome P450 n=1 Tax=Zophobas morio TaxID=2755281 RepID=A0AA38IHQ1_9CUCU|nr:hypothetical protein Zmor_015252 [Zophobas morio]
MFCSAESVITLIAIIAVPLYFYYVKIYRIRKFLKNFPSPPTTRPILGVALDFRTPGEFLQKLHEYTKTCGSMINLQIGPIGQVLVSSDYNFLEFLLSSNKLLRKTRNLKFLEPWIGNGLVLAEGSRWKTHRKLITPAFHFKILEQFISVFESEGDVMVEKLSTESGNKSVDIYPYITKCTLEAICETAMGTKVDVQNNETSSYFEGVKEMCRIFAVRTTSVFLGNDFFFKFTKDYKIQQEAVKILHGYTNNVIKIKRAEHEKGKHESGEVDELGRRKKKAFLDLILEAKLDNQSLTDEEIREEVDTFMFAGHDTTATALSFILFCIANSKEVQDKILAEQEQLFGQDKNPTVTYANLQDMKYLENVVKEGLRLYSPVPLYGRLIDQEVEYNGMVFPKNLGVLIFSHGLHMNPKYYPNPEKFDPSRFENYDNKLPFAFIPFSAGPRNCIGQKYAMLEIKSMASKIVRNFELSPAEPRHDMDLSPVTVLKSLNGVRVGLKLR